MRDPRSVKRRKVDDDGDEAMLDADQDIYAIPSSPIRPDQGGEQESPSADRNDENEITPETPTKPSRRRASRGRSEAVEDQPLDDKSRNENGTETPSRAGLRSSGRQRKAPKRYEDEVIATPPSVRRTTVTPAKDSRTTRSARKAKQILETNEAGRESPQPQVSSVARTRSKRTSVRFKTDGTAGNEEPSGDMEEIRPSPLIEEDQAGIDDLVAMQLQEEMLQNEGEGKESSALTTDPLPDYAERLRDLCLKGLQDELRTLAKVILEKLNGKRLTPLKGLEGEYQKVHQLIEQTVTVGEGNSMLLLGSRGCGKTAMVETIISSLAKEHKNDFHVVRLNGFIHTDDRLALREMWRQLGRETNTEDEATKVSSYADTLATLLALLSHPDELFGSTENSETMTTAKSIVIILDEFDLFVSHPRQTLLYNLFDIAQARKAPIAVIGLTTKVDVTEMLEKRVKSRFSHRSVFLPLPRTFETFSEICLAGLDLEESEFADLGSDGHLEESAIKSEAWRMLLDGWRNYLKGLWSDEKFQYHLQRIFYQTKSVKEFFTSALIPLSDLHHSARPIADNDSIPLQVPTPKSFMDQSLSCPDPAPLPFPSSTTISSSSSSLPLSLLLAATRLTALYDPGLEAGQPLALSFPAAYAEYVRLLTSAKVSASASGAAATPGRVWGRDVAREAWEKLVSWGLVVPVGGGGSTADGRMFRVEISFEEVVEMVGSEGSLGKWWRDG